MAKKLTRNTGRHCLDGEPYYCIICGLGWNEYGACEEVACKLESNEEAKRRTAPTQETPNE